MPRFSNKKPHNSSTSMQDRDEQPPRAKQPESFLENLLNSLFGKFRGLGHSHSSNVLGPFTDLKKITSEERFLISNFLKFYDKTVEEVMVPRSSIIALAHNTSLKELSEVINKYSHTRIFIYQDSLDNIIGFVHMKDLFKIVTKRQNFQLSKILRKPIISTPPMKLFNLFKEMQAKRIHIAIVVDEYGTIDGMITIENILEVIFGEIDDEHDPVSNRNYQIIDSHTLLVSGTTTLEVLQNLLGIKLKQETDEFETIGGLVLAKVGTVPARGAIISISDEIELEVIDSSRRALKKIKLMLKNITVPDTQSVKR